MKIFGFGQDEVGLSTRKYQILGKFIPIKDISDIWASDKLVVREASMGVDYWGSKYLAESILEIKSDIRGIFKEE